MEEGSGRSRAASKKEERDHSANSSIEKERGRCFLQDERGVRDSRQDQESGGRSRGVRKAGRAYLAQPSKSCTRHCPSRKRRDRQCRSEKVGDDPLIQFQSARSHRSRSQGWTHRYREGWSSRRGTLLLFER